MQKLSNPFHALTENSALAFASSQSGCVDLFSKALRDIDKQRMNELLESSWMENKLDTVKLIFYKRDCRAGSGEKRLFYWAIQWLINKDIQSVKLNMEHIPEYGTYKDFLQIFFDTPLETEMLNIYAQQLIQDHFKLSQNSAMSLAPKWAPTENRMHDKKYKAVEKLSKSMKVNKVTYRKKYITPMREYLKVVERLMCGNQWDQIDYSKVPSVAMNKLRKAFSKHDPEGFLKYLSDLKEGKTKINAGQMFPHQLVGYYLSRNAEQDDVIDEQWKALVAKTKEYGKLDRCLALCDVSGSMMGTPMEVSIALGLMIAEISEEPFKNMVITFDVEPQFYNVTAAKLRDRINQVHSMPWGGNTNIQVAFDKILQRAQQFNLPEEQMPRILFIFSDMQFDQAVDGNYLTNFQTLQAKYQAAGYQMPQVVFWNLRGQPTNQPVTSDEKGVALVSGFSTSLLKLFTEGTIESPYETMRKAIDDPRYDRIKLAPQQ